MKFIILSFLALGASASVLEAPTRVIEKRIIESRDLQTIQNVLGTVSQSLAALNAAATGFAGDVGPLQSAGTALSDAISSGVSTVQGTDAISVTDAVALQATSEQLSTVAESLVSSLAAQKEAIQQAGACDTVRAQSDTINSNSQQLIDAVVSKVPTEVQSIASQIVGGFTSTLQQNAANFAEGNCTNAAGGGGGGAAASSSAAPSTSSATGAPAPTSTTSRATGASSGNTATARPTTGGAGSVGTTRPTGATGAPTSRPTVVTAGAAATAVPVGMWLAFAAVLV